MKILINGGCGFLGSNIANYGIINGYDITVLDNLSRTGANLNLKWLETIGEFKFIHGDVRCKSDIEEVVKTGQFDAVFQFAGQVTMTKSLENPYKDFETNTMGTLNTLEAIRKYSPNTAMFFSSTNKVYGDLEQYNYREDDKRYTCVEYPNGFDESINLSFESPYGCSKGAADQYMLDYYRMFGIKTVVFRHSSMYGSRQFATYDQGWIGWFVMKAIEQSRGVSEPFTISGNGKQVRDVLYVDDMVKLYYDSLEKMDDVCGNAYNIGGTIEQSLSLLELFEILEERLDVKLNYNRINPRESDQRFFVADITKINKKIGWKPNVNAMEGIYQMIDWVLAVNKKGIGVSG